MNTAEDLAKAKSRIEQYRKLKVSTSALPSDTKLSAIDKLSDPQKFVESRSKLPIKTLLDLANRVEMICYVEGNFYRAGTRKLKANEKADCPFYRVSTITRACENIFGIKTKNSNERGVIKSIATAIAGQAYYGFAKGDSLLEAHQSAIVKGAATYSNALWKISLEAEKFELTNEQLNYSSPFGLPGLHEGFWESKFNGNEPESEYTRALVSTTVESLNRASSYKTIVWLNPTDIAIYCAAFYYWTMRKRDGVSVAAGGVYLGKTLYDTCTQYIISDISKMPIELVKRSKKPSRDEVATPQVVEVTSLMDKIKEGVLVERFINEILPEAYEFIGDKVKVSEQTIDNLYRKYGGKGKPRSRLFGADDLAFFLSCYTSFAPYKNEAAMRFLSSYAEKVATIRAVENGQFLNNVRNTK